MENEKIQEKRSSRPRRPIIAAAAVLTAMLGSTAYGYLVREYRFFPYRLLKHGQNALRAASGHPVEATAHGHHLRLAADAIDRLMNLPYLRGYTPATEAGGVRIHEQGLSQNGLNFFTSTHAPVVTLMDMDGAVVKTWIADMAKAFPALRRTKHRGHEKFLRDAELLPDGGIVAMFDQVGVVRLDADSRVLWAWGGAVHHDLFIGEDGNVWTLLHKRNVVPDLGRDTPVIEDFAVELSPEGRTLRQLSLVQCFLRSRYAPVLSSLWEKSGDDIFHTNSLAVLDGSLAGRHPAFRRGNLVISLRNLNVIAVVDPHERRVVWALTGIWRGQHSASIVSPGHILLFDNFGTMQLASRALEVDPLTQHILWSYGGRADQQLLSETLGHVERLRNGNTLITESNYGRALEVTSDDRVAWEFVNPNRTGAKKEFIAVLNFMKRVDGDLPFLKRPAAGSPSRPKVSVLR